MNLTKSLIAACYVFIAVLGSYSVALSNEEDPDEKQPRRDVKIVVFSDRNEPHIFKDWFDVKGYISTKTFFRSGEKVDVDDFISGADWITGQNQNGNQFHIAYLDAVLSDIPRKKQELLHDAIRSLVKSGTSVVVPAGNQGRKISKDKSTVLPAGFSETITVASLDSGFLRLHEKSNFGPEIDLATNPENTDLRDVMPPSQGAALNAIRLIAEYIYESFKQIKPTQSPSPRLVKWELTEGQTPQKQVEIPKTGEKRTYAVPTFLEPKYKGDRVPDDYELLSARSSNGRKQKPASAPDSQLEYELTFDLSKEDFESKKLIRKQIRDIFDLDKTPVTLELHENDTSITGGTLRAPEAVLGVDDKFYHSNQTPIHMEFQEKTGQLERQAELKFARQIRDQLNKDNGDFVEAEATIPPPWQDLAYVKVDLVLRK